MYVHGWACPSFFSIQQRRAFQIFSCIWDWASCSWCGEYGYELWASWLRWEPPDEDVGLQWPLTGHASPVSPSKCLKWEEPSSIFWLLSPGKVPKTPLETRLEAILVLPVESAPISLHWDPHCKCTAALLPYILAIWMYHHREHRITPESPECVFASCNYQHRSAKDDKRMRKSGSSTVEMSKTTSKCCPTSCGYSLSLRIVD